MALSDVMRGWIAQQEFAKLLMIGSNGNIELTPPMTDDDRRDFEVHLKKHFGFNMALQVKGRFVVTHYPDTTAHYLHVTLADLRSRIVTSPFFWYFFAHFSRRLMRFTDPLFLVPSAVLHATPGRHPRPDYVQFQFTANLEPTARDKWVPYRVNSADLGKKMLEIITGLEGHPAGPKLAASPLIYLPGVNWFRAAGTR